MSPESYEIAKIWLAKASSDLATARLLITGNEQHLDTGSYHCQQAAEKAIKAFRYPGDIFEPTHEEAVRVLNLAEELTSWINREFNKIGDF